MLKYVLKFKSDSHLKPLPFDLNRLDLGAVKSYKAGDEIDISAYTANLQGNHVRVILENFNPASDFIENVEKLFYCSAEDIEILLSEVSFDGEDPQQFPVPRPSKVDLDVPYHSQLNNKNNPYGSCNVTSMAMLLKYYGVDSRTEADFDRDVQLEDVLYERTLDWDDEYGMTTRHDPYYLIRLVREWGEKYGDGALPDSYFNPTASEEDIKQHIAQGNPVVVHGYFTGFGHIILVKGYDDETQEWIFNDPYGKWLGYSGGYDNNVSGGNVRYHYDNFYNACYEDGIWCHFPVPRTLKLNQSPMKGAEIKKLQTQLKQKGFSIEETGSYDQKTADIVKQFQQQNRLAADGIVGSGTWGALLIVWLNTDLSNPSSSLARRTLRIFNCQVYCDEFIF